MSDDGMIPWTGEAPERGEGWYAAEYRAAVGHLVPCMTEYVHADGAWYPRVERYYPTPIDPSDVPGLLRAREDMRVAMRESRALGARAQQLATLLDAAHADQQRLNQILRERDRAESQRDTATRRCQRCGVTQSDVVDGWTCEDDERWLCVVCGPLEQAERGGEPSGVRGRLPWRETHEPDGSVTMECPQGLWSVNGRDRPALLRESAHYYRQYEVDGKYTDSAPPTESGEARDVAQPSRDVAQLSGDVLEELRRRCDEWLSERSALGYTAHGDGMEAGVELVMDWIINALAAAPVVRDTGGTVPEAVPERVLETDPLDAAVEAVIVAIFGEGAQAGAAASTEAARAALRLYVQPWEASDLHRRCANIASREYLESRTDIYLGGYGSDAELSAFHHGMATMHRCVQASLEEALPPAGDIDAAAEACLAEAMRYGGRYWDADDFRAAIAPHWPHAPENNA